MEPAGGVAEKELAGPSPMDDLRRSPSPFQHCFSGATAPFRTMGTLQKDKVEFDLCGHEHDIEHLEIPKWFTSFVIDGGGGAHTHPLSRDYRGFSRQAFGFVHFDPHLIRRLLRFIGSDNQPMHTFERTKAGEVKILKPPRTHRGLIPDGLPCT